MMRAIKQWWLRLRIERLRRDYYALGSIMMDDCASQTGVYDTMIGPYNRIHDEMNRLTGELIDLDE